MQYTLLPSEASLKVFGLVGSNAFLGVPSDRTTRLPVDYRPPSSINDNGHEPSDELGRMGGTPVMAAFLPAWIATNRTDVSQESIQVVPDDTCRSTAGPRVIGQEDEWKVCERCGCDVFSGDSCDHLVTVLCDDSSGVVEPVAPIYFGNGVMGDQFDELFNVIVEFATQYAGDDKVQRAGTMALVSAASLGVKSLLTTAINGVENPRCGAEGPLGAWVREELHCELRSGLRDLFEKLFEAQPNTGAAEKWCICQPFVSWSGTTYWAKDGYRCAKGSQTASTS